MRNTGAGAFVLYMVYGLLTFFNINIKGHQLFSDKILRDINFFLDIPKYFCQTCSSGGGGGNLDMS